MRVLMASQYFDPASGGSERQACQQAEDLARAGASVTVIARRASGVREQGLPGIREIRVGCPSSPGPREGGSLRASLGFGLRVSTYILLHGGSYDVLHLQGAGLSSALAIPAARARGLRVAAKVSGGRSGTEAGSLRGLGRLALPVFRKVDAWIAVSAEIAEGLQADGVPGERIHRIPNAVDTARFRPLGSENRDAVRRALDWPARAPVAVFSGRLIPSKGLASFLAAWRGASKPEGALLAVLGDGSERSVLESEAKADPSVRFLGLRNDVELVLAAADLFVFPSRREGMPNAVLEAMACGLPVAAFRIGGVRDLVDDGREGVLLVEGDDVGLARKSAELLADASGRAALGTAARRRAECFDRNGTARRLKAVLEGR